MEISRRVLMDLDNIECLSSSDDEEEEERNAQHYHRRNYCSKNRKLKIPKYSCYMGDETANQKLNTMSDSLEYETKLETITTTN